MAQIIIDVPTALIPRVLEAHGAANAAGFKAYLIAQIKAKTADYEATKAEQATRDAQLATTVTDMGAIQ